MQNSELEIGYGKFTSQVNMPWNTQKWQLVLNSTNSPALKNRWRLLLHLDYEGCMIAVPIYQYYTLSNSAPRQGVWLLRSATS